jgi:hypothetical protein
MHNSLIIQSVYKVNTYTFFNSLIQIEVINRWCNAEPQQKNLQTYQV